MTHRILERKAWAIAHELDGEIARRDRDTDIGRADCKWRLGEHLGDPSAASETRRCSTTSESGMKASFNSELRDAVARIPITFQSSLNIQPGSIAREMKQVRMVGPSGASSQVASKKKSIATLWVPKILRPLTMPSAVNPARVVRGRNCNDRVVGLRARSAADQPLSRDSRAASLRRWAL